MTVAKFDEVALLFAFWSSVVFILGYTAASPWWRYKVGRAMVVLDAAITLTLLPSAARYMFGVSPHGHVLLWYAGFSLVLVGLISLWRLWVVWSVQSDATPRHTAAALLDEKEVSQ